MCMYVWLRFKTMPNIRNVIFFFLMFRMIKHTHARTYIHTYIYICMYVYIYIYVCICIKADYLSCTCHPERLATSLKATLHICTFSMFSFNFSSCSLKASIKVPVCFRTSNGCTL